MARGYAIDLQPAYSPYETFSSPVIAVVAAPAYASVDLLERSLSDGKARVGSDTLWIVRRPRTGTVDAVVHDLLSDQENLLVLDTQKGWGPDWRDYELIFGCSKVIVFHRPGSSRTDIFAKPHIRRAFPNIVLIEED